jgi:hypothetical protein
MIDTVKRIESLFETFDQSGRNDFRLFLKENPGIRKWSIAADFCLHDKDRPNNVFAFSIFPHYPHYTNFDIITEEIRAAIPKDWKKTKNISAETITFLKDKRRFHIAFVLPKPPAVFGDDHGINSIEMARRSLEITVDEMIAKGHSDKSLSRLRRLKQETLAKNFNVKLLSDLYFLNDLFCFVTLLLARDRPLEVVSWMPDRDKMTTWCEGVLFDIGAEHLHGLAERFKLNVPAKGPFVCIPTPAEELAELVAAAAEVADGTGVDTVPDKEKSAMWFDDLIRLPDYVAGVFSAWNFETNEFPDEKEKYRIMVRDFAAFAENIMVFKIRYDDSFQASRLVFKYQPPTP